MFRFAPPVLPMHWIEGPLPAPLVEAEGASYVRADGAMSVLVTVEPHNETTWLHVSVARRDRYPSWEEIRAVKDLFIGKDKDAVMILPREEDYVNIHSNCFHVYHRIDGDTVAGNPQRE